MTGSILTIVTPAATHDLTVIETVKDELGITDTAQDDRLYRWISEASGFVRSYCNRTFAEEGLSEQWRDVRLNRDVPLVLRRRPVSTITSVIADGTALTTDEYEVDGHTGMLWRLSGGATGHRVHWCALLVVVTYTAGYALLDGLPYGIETACIETIKHRVAARNRDPSLRMQEIPGELVQQWWVPGANEDGVPPEIRAMLDPYRELNV